MSSLRRFSIGFAAFVLLVGPPVLGSAEEETVQQEVAQIIREAYAPQISDSRLEKSMHYSETVLYKDVQQVYQHCVHTGLLPENMDFRVYFIWKNERETDPGRLSGMYIPDTDLICVNLSQYEMMSALKRKQELTIVVAREGTTMLADMEGLTGVKKILKIFSVASRATQQMYGKQALESKKAFALYRAFFSVVKQRESICKWAGISSDQFEQLDYRDLQVLDTVVRMTLVNPEEGKPAVRIACMPTGEVVLQSDQPKQKRPLRVEDEESSKRLQGNGLDAAGMYASSKAAKAAAEKERGAKVTAERKQAKPFKKPAPRKMKVQGLNESAWQVKVAFLDESSRMIDVMDGQGKLVEQYVLEDWKVTPLDVKTGQPMDTPLAAKIDQTAGGTVMQLETDHGVGLSLKFDKQGSLSGVSGQVIEGKSKPAADLQQPDRDTRHPFTGKKIPSVELPESH